MKVRIPEGLERHIEQKIANHYWLESCLEGEAESFPYRPAENGRAKIETPIVPAKQSRDRVSPQNTSSPQFIVNIPMRRLPTTSSSHSKVTSLFKLIRDQAFGGTSRTSAKEVKQRLAVVLGINQIKSIDPMLNRNFNNYIRGLPAVHDVVNRVVGFLWEPEWETDFGKKPNASKEFEKKWKTHQWTLLKTRVHPLKKAFLLLKALSAKQAKNVRETHEQPEGRLHSAICEQVPFQRIRETIKTSISTRTFLDQIQENAPDAPIYYATMDDDCLDLRAETGRGVFSRLDDLIAEKNAPSIASLGYSFGDEESDLLRLTVKIDMAVRAAMPMPYFPEPFTAYKARRPGAPPFLNRLSFVGGRGEKLESRRFINSGQELFTDGAVLKNDGGVVIRAPYRMKTEYNQKVETLTPEILKKKKTLQALRSSRAQSHAFPKQWSGSLYAGLPFSCPQPTDAEVPMRHILSVFDPISRMHVTDKYTSKVFDKVMKNYRDPLNDAQKNLIKTARGKLYNLGMKKKLIDLVEETAKRSGEAIYQVLKKTLDDLEY